MQKYNQGTEFSNRKYVGWQVPKERLVVNIFQGKRYEMHLSMMVGTI